MGARAAVRGDHGIQRQFFRRFRRLERASDRGNDVDEAALPLEEERHGFLVGGVEYGGRGAPPPPPPPGQRPAPGAPPAPSVEGERGGGREVGRRRPALATGRGD